MPAMGYERIGLLAMRLLAMTYNDGLLADRLAITPVSDRLVFLASLPARPHLCPSVGPPHLKLCVPSIELITCRPLLRCSSLKPPVRALCALL